LFECLVSSQKKEINYCFFCVVYVNAPDIPYVLVMLGFAAHLLVAIWQLEGFMNWDWN
jgi:hypothetical protein